MNMNTISSLPDDLLVKILSTDSLSLKEVIATSLLSKRWHFLWNQVTRLSYDYRLLDSEKFSRFVSSCLRFSNAGVVQSFHLKLHRLSNLDRYIALLADLSVREVSIESVYGSYTLPESLYNRSWTLQTLILQTLNLEDVIPCTQVGLQMRFLKSLHLLSVKFSDDESVERFLSTCPVLEDLVVRRTPYVNVMMFTINVPTLRSLSIHYSGKVSQPVGVRGFVIDAPSLRYLNIRDYLSNALRFGHMPELVKANVEVACYDNFLGSLTSIQHLSLCSKTSKNNMYPSGTSFLALEHVELCTCSPVWWNLLNFILEEAPNLQVLKLKLKHYVRYSSSDPVDRMNQPCFVPKCLQSRLEISEWSHYVGTKKEKKVGKYMLKNSKEETVIQEVNICCQIRSMSACL